MSLDTACKSRLKIPMKIWIFTLAAVAVATAICVALVILIPKLKAAQYIKQLDVNNRQTIINALRYAAYDPDFLLHLAQSLQEAGQPHNAQAVLMHLLYNADDTNSDAYLLLSESLIESGENTFFIRQILDLAMTKAASARLETLKARYAEMPIIQKNAVGSLESAPLSEQYDIDEQGRLFYLGKQVKNTSLPTARYITAHAQSAFICDADGGGIYRIDYDGYIFHKISEINADYMAAATDGLIILDSADGLLKKLSFNGADIFVINTTPMSEALLHGSLLYYIDMSGRLILPDDTEAALTEAPYTAGRLSLQEGMVTFELYDADNIRTGRYTITSDGRIEQV